MQITHRRLVQFLNACAQWLAAESTAPLKAEKFAYAVRKLQKAGVPIYEATIEKRTEQIESAEVDLAEERDGVIRRNSQGGFEYSKPNLKALMAARREIDAKINDHKVEIAEFLVKTEHIPADLLPELRDAFEGLLIAPESDLKLVDRQA